MRVLACEGGSRFAPIRLGIFSSSWLLWAAAFRLHLQKVSLHHARIRSFASQMLSESRFRAIYGLDRVHQQRRFACVTNEMANPRRDP
jgi:hypothetical protein